MQNNEGNDAEPVFCIECCQDTATCGFHTRIDVAKYAEYFNRGKFCPCKQPRQKGGDPSLMTADRIFLALTLSSVSVSGAIAERIPNSITMKNQIPKSYLHYDLYCNLIPNEDENAPYFQ